jgi:hypothetical protein
MRTSFGPCACGDTQCPSCGTAQGTLARTITCACGEELELDDPMTNRCACGQFYNGSGQRLSHPKNWGEETGESFDDFGNYVVGSEEEL